MTESAMFAQMREEGGDEIDSEKIKEEKNRLQSDTVLRLHVIMTVEHVIGLVQNRKHQEEIKPVRMRQR